MVEKDYLDGGGGGKWLILEKDGTKARGWKESAVLGRSVVG